jgi:hypothetical protein
MPQEFRRATAGREHHANIPTAFRSTFPAHFLHTSPVVKWPNFQSRVAVWLMPDQSAGVMSSSLQSAALGNKDR